MSVMIVASLFVAAMLAAGYWGRELWRDWKVQNTVPNRDHGMDFFRDALLAIVTLAVLGGLIHRQLRDINSPNMRARDMDSYSDILQKMLVATLAFLVLYGLAVAVLPQIFPDQGTLKNRVLSESAAIAIGLILALSAATNESLNESIRIWVEEKGVEVLFSFLSVLFAAIAVYLVWKRLSTTVLPTGKNKKPR